LQDRAVELEADEDGAGADLEFAGGLGWNRGNISGDFER